MTQRSSIRWLALGNAVVVATAATLLPACSGFDRSTLWEPSADGAPAALRVVAEGTESLAASFAVGIPFTVDVAGRLDATIDYLSGASQVGVWIAQGKCSFEQFEADECRYAALSLSGNTPRRLVVAEAAPGEYTLIAANLGANDERVSYRVVRMTSSTSATMSVPVPRPASDRPGWYGPHALAR